MLFDTPVYFLFLALVVIVYWRLTWRPQNLLLLAASYFFYGWWDWRFLLLMIASTTIDYIIAQNIEDVSDPSKRKGLLIASLVVNFTILGFFKYFNFFLDSTASSLDALGFHNVPRSLLVTILPPGISFYTFQEVAYIVDVYAGRIKASRSFVDYGLFISLFPHLIAGPIQRPSHLLPQVQKLREFNPAAFRDGCMLILMGLVRKSVIADNCAHLANAAFSGRLGNDGWSTLIGIYAFAWQIYGDFSGYSDLARGSAQLLGFHFMVNFRQPYLATSLQDFWRRWHISLSSWLRDYLYIPLGGNRQGKWRTYLNLMITMLLGGLWHGANWTFVVWGGIHGTGLAVERLFTGNRDLSGSRSFWARWSRRVFVFHVVCLGWVFFRITSFRGAWEQLAILAHWRWMPVYGIALQFLALCALMLFLLDLQLESANGEYIFAFRSYPGRVAAGFVLCVLATLLGANQVNAFLYFQF